MVQDHTRTLRIVAEKASNLPPCTLTMLRDPYLVFELGKQQCQTRVAHKTLDPTWHEELELSLHEDNDSSLLIITLYDHNVMQSDERLGQLVVDLKQYHHVSPSQGVKVEVFKCQIDHHTCPSYTLECDIVLGIAVETPAPSSVWSRVWENQRWTPSTASWSKDNLMPILGDRKAWSSNSRGGDHFKDAIPAVPDGYKPKGAWVFNLSCCDLDGWRYATSFSGPWHSSMDVLPHPFVREITGNEEIYVDVAGHPSRHIETSMVATTEPTRRLRIELSRATNVPPSHPDAATSDPYVFIQLGNNHWQSQVARKTLNPSWHNQVCEFLVSDSESASDMELKIWINDLDTIALEDALGSISFPLNKWTGATSMKLAQVLPYQLKTKYPTETMLYMKICLEGWISSFVVSVWENQRWAPGANRWSKDYLSLKIGDRMPWTGPENGANLFKDAVPPIPINYQAKGPWKFLVDHGDINGWMYASSFKGPWKKEMAKHHTVRCREWTNEYVLAPTITLKSTPSQKDFEF